MRKTKPATPLPPLPLRAPSLPGQKPIPTLPNGHLDCNPELPDPGGHLAELMDAVGFEVRQANYKPVGMTNTDAATLNRATAAEQEQAGKLAAIQPPALPKWKTTRPGRAAQPARSGKRPPGRPKAAHTGTLEKALLVNSHLPPMAAPLADWLTVLDNKGIMFPVPDSAPPRSISYPDAWKDQDYQNMIRKRLRKILGSKLLPA